MRPKENAGFSPPSHICNIPGRCASGVRTGGGFYSPRSAASVSLYLQYNFMQMNFRYFCAKKKGKRFEIDWRKTEDTLFLHPLKASSGLVAKWLALWPLVSKASG
ncbi:hypothetical protein CDAR_52981 [Caerostris darwini]|uniref:Uncharacterized protein n=1 Tax=Caerostris darwini TaxID=1538125 RepID=A0AAV4QQV2_9ARAC|nr:hypothetical protein CDAR_52981 [Caerostris darwini]